MNIDCNHFYVDLKIQGNLPHFVNPTQVLIFYRRDFYSHSTSAFCFKLHILFHFILNYSREFKSGIFGISATVLMALSIKAGEWGYLLTVPYGLKNVLLISRFSYLSKKKSSCFLHKTILAPRLWLSSHFSLFIKRLA